MAKKIVCYLLLSLFLCAQSAWAVVDPRDTSRFMYGFQKILSSTIQLPLQTIQSTLRGPIGLGTVQGVLTGTAGTVTNMVGGLFDMAAASAPYAKYAVLFV
jgi:hypothetical protein